MNENEKSSGVLGILSLVISIAALLLFCTGMISFVLAIIAIVLSCLEKKPGGPKIAGLIIGIFAIIFSLIMVGMMFLGLSLFNSAGKWVEENKDEIEETIEGTIEQRINDSQAYNNYVYDYLDANESYLLGTWEDYNGKVGRT